MGPRKFIRYNDLFVIGIAYIQLFSRVGTKSVFVISIENVIRMFVIASFHCILLTTQGQPAQARALANTLVKYKAEHGKAVFLPFLVKYS